MEKLKTIFIGISTVVLLVVAITLCFCGKFYFYAGMTILVSTSICALVYLNLLIVDKIAKNKFTNENKKYKTAVEVFKWLGFWWLYVPYKIYNELKKLTLPFPSLPAPFPGAVPSPPPMSAT